MYNFKESLNECIESRKKDSYSLLEILKLRSIICKIVRPIVIVVVTDPGRKIRTNDYRQIVFPGRFDREFYQGRRGNAKRSRTSGDRKVYRFLQRISRMLYTSSPTFTPPRSIEPSLLPLPVHPWIWSMDPDPPKRGPSFSESLISVLLAFFFSNQPDSRRIWSKRARGQGQTDWRLRIIYDTVTFDPSTKNCASFEGRRKDPFSRIRFHTITIFRSPCISISISIVYNYSYFKGKEEFRGYFRKDQIFTKKNIFIRDASNKKEEKL